MNAPAAAAPPPVVYIPQQPSRYDSSLQLWVPSVNLNPARRFGVLNIMLPPNLSSMMPGPLVEVLKDRMASFSRRDFLLAAGDPSLIAAAAGIAFARTGGTLKFLKWDRMAKDYIEVEITL